MRALRVIEATASIFIWLKSLYFLQLFDEFSQLVLTAYQVLLEIRWFIIVILIIILAFGNAFWLIGRNQLHYDRVENVKDISYYNFWQTSLYMYYQMLGELILDPFEAGKDPTHEAVLWILFLLSSFTLIVTLLNMLVAIMGER